MCPPLAYLVPEACIIRVLHDSHELNGVVPLTHNPRNNVPRKLQVSTHSMLTGGNAHVTLVNSETFRPLRLWMLPLVKVLRLRMPETLFVVGTFVQVWGSCYVLCPRAQTLQKLSVMVFNDDLHFRVVGNSTGSISVRRKLQFPFTEL